MTAPPNPPNQPPQLPSPLAKMRNAVVDVMQDVAEKKQAMKQETKQELERRRKREQRRWLWVALAAIALIISVAVNLPRWQHPFQSPTGAAAESDARHAILLAVNLVERYRATTGQLPGTLAETGISLPGVVYRPSQGGYEISVMVGGIPVVFHSGDDQASFRGAAH